MTDPTRTGWRGPERNTRVTRERRKSAHTRASSRAPRGGASRCVLLCWGWAKRNPPFIFTQQTSLNTGYAPSRACGDAPSKSPGARGKMLSPTSEAARAALLLHHHVDHVACVEVSSGERHPRAVPVCGGRGAIVLPPTDCTSPHSPCTYPEPSLHPTRRGWAGSARTLPAVCCGSFCPH